MHRLRMDVAAADRERSRLEGRLAAKEREIGGLANKASVWGGGGRVVGVWGAVSGCVGAGKRCSCFWGMDPQCCVQRHRDSALTRSCTPPPAPSLPSAHRPRPWARRTRRTSRRRGGTPTSCRRRCGWGGGGRGHGAGGRGQCGSLGAGEAWGAGCFVLRPRSSAVLSRRPSSCFACIHMRACCVHLLLLDAAACYRLPACLPAGHRV